VLGVVGLPVAGDGEDFNESTRASSGKRGRRVDGTEHFEYP